MEFEEIICPNCGSTLMAEDLRKNLRCSVCKVNFHQNRYVGFLEYLMMNGYVQELDFFDKTVYGDEINHTSETEEELRRMFKEIQIPFHKFCPPERKNFLSYSYVLHKFCELLEYDYLLPYFPLLKSREKLHAQDIIWEKICKDLNWEFIPSL